jgi:S-DNA-T family DNA segregation ATPase FtsK/SpoIIIE
MHIHVAYMTSGVLNETIGKLKREYPKELKSELEAAEEYARRESLFSSDDPNEEDELYGDAENAVRECGKASTSYLQRKLGIGYSRAAKLIEMLEHQGVIGR